MTNQLQAQTRRALLVGAAGAVAGWAAGLFGRVAPAAAANGSPVLLGVSTNAATATTQVTTTSGSGLAGTGPIGINGTTTSTAATSAGVYGVSSSTLNYGVMSSGKMGVVGPIELAAITITNFSGPTAGKSFLYVKTTTTGTELHVKFPSGVDKLITSG